MTGFIPALDGLRGLAILLVLFHHLTILDPVSGADRMLYEASHLGWAGVDLFFVLSGFLITGILIDARGSDRYFTSFYARRTLRIFPLYYLVVFLSVVVLPLFPRWHGLLAGGGVGLDVWPYWLYLTNFAVADRGAFHHGILDIAWSLAIEEQFYIVWAVVVFLCPPRLLLWLCGAIVVVSPIARTLALSAGVEAIDIYVLTFYRADGLATGALLACIVRGAAVARLAPIALAVAAAGGAGLGWVWWQAGDAWWMRPLMQQAGYSLVAVTAGALLMAALTQPQTHLLPRLLSAGWLRTFGKYSYCLYLIHLPVMRTVRTVVLPPEQFAQLGAVWAGQLAFYAIATAAALALAWLSWRYFEAPILRLKAKFPY